MYAIRSYYGLVAVLQETVLRKMRRQGAVFAAKPLCALATIRLEHAMTDLQPTLLVVDDEEFNRDLISEYLV